MLRTVTYLVSLSFLLPACLYYSLLETDPWLDGSELALNSLFSSSRREIRSPTLLSFSNKFTEVSTSIANGLPQYHGEITDAGVRYPNLQKAALNFLNKLQDHGATFLSKEEADKGKKIVANGGWNEDPIGTELAVTRKLFADTVDSAMATVLKAFDAEMKKIAARGDLDRYKALRADKELIRMKVNLPVTHPMSKHQVFYRKDVLCAAELLAETLEATMKKYTMMLEIDKATAIQSEWRELRRLLDTKAAPEHAVDSILQVRKWVGFGNNKVLVGTELIPAKVPETGTNEDPIGTELDLAEKAYEDTVVSAKETLLRAFDDEMKKIAARGDLDRYKALRADKELARREVNLPVTHPMNKHQVFYRKDVLCAAELLAETLEATVKKYTMMLEIDKATAVQKKWRALRRLLDTPQASGDATDPVFKEKKVPGYPKKHTIKVGESYWAIAVQHYGARRGYLHPRISKANKGVKFHPGTVIIIPAPPLFLTAISPAPPSPVQGTFLSTYKKIKGYPKRHTIKNGDSYWTIAAQHYGSKKGELWERISKANGEVSCRPGTVIIIPPPPLFLTADEAGSIIGRFILLGYCDLSDKKRIGWEMVKGVDTTRNLVEINYVLQALRKYARKDFTDNLFYSESEKELSPTRRALSPPYLSPRQ